MALARCSSSSPDAAFSCTDEGIVQTRLVATEIADTLGGSYPVSTAGDGQAHGCDSTAHGVYDFLSIERDAIAAAFSCRPDESLGRGWTRCSAASGTFALSPTSATIEVVPDG